jgi:hypothetical protein
LFCIFAYIKIAMGKLKFVFFCLIIPGIMGYACKKIEVDDKTLVERKFVGRWPLKMHIEIDFKNNAIVRNDTSSFTTAATIDTLIYTSDMKFTKGASTVNYSIDPTGENITYTTTPDSTWRINFLRVNSIILSHQRMETIGTDRYVYYVEEQLIK